MGDDHSSHYFIRLLRAAGRHNLAADFIFDLNNPRINQTSVRDLRGLRPDETQLYALRVVKKAFKDRSSAILLIVDDGMTWPLLTLLRARQLRCAAHAARPQGGALVVLLRTYTHIDTVARRYDSIVESVNEGRFNMSLLSALRHSALPHHNHLALSRSVSEGRRRYSNLQWPDRSGSITAAVCCTAALVAVAAYIWLQFGLNFDQLMPYRSYK